MRCIFLATSNVNDNWPIAILFFVFGISMLFNRFWRSDTLMSNEYERTTRIPIIGRIYKWIVPYDQYRPMFTAFRIITGTLFVCLAVAIGVAAIVQ
jgi:type II secretory pathway component PulF